MSGVGIAVGGAGRLRRAAETTPGRLRVLSLVAVASLILLGAFGLSAVSHRQSGLRAVGAQSEPLIVDAQSIDTLLSQADAVAANAFLSGGIEPASLRAQYLASIAGATQTLADASERSGTTADQHAALSTLSQQIPIYTGLVETARANNRQGYPVGAAYLRQANQLLTMTILPATRTLFSLDSARLGRGQSAARSSVDTTLLGLGAVMALLALVVTQIWLRRRTNRILNVGLAIATVLVAVGAITTAASLRSESSAIAHGRDHGFAVVNSAAQARIAAFRAKSDESLTLIGRGEYPAFDVDFNAQAKQLTSLIGGLPADAAGGAKAAEQAYLAVHTKIRAADDGGQFNQAVQLAVGTGLTSANQTTANQTTANQTTANQTSANQTSANQTSANQAFASLDNALTQTLSAGQIQFASDVSRADNKVAHLKLVLTVALVLAAGLALWGAQQRINEYR